MIIRDLNDGSYRTQQGEKVKCIICDDIILAYTAPEWALQSICSKKCLEQHKMKSTYEELLPPEKLKKLNDALEAGVTAQNQERFMIGMIKNLIMIIDNNKTDSIPTDTVRSWIKSVISGLSAMQ